PPFGGVVVKAGLAAQQIEPGRRARRPFALDGVGRGRRRRVGVFPGAVGIEQDSATRGRDHALLSGKPLGKRQREENYQMAHGVSLTDVVNSRDVLWSLRSRP